MQQDGLAHPVRRLILRTLNESTVGLSPSDIAARFDLQVARVQYHAFRLEEAGLAVSGRPPSERGAVWFASTDTGIRLGRLLDDLEARGESFLPDGESSDGP